MRLTLHTDYALWVLMFAAAKGDALATELRECQSDGESLDGIRVIRPDRRILAETRTARPLEERSGTGICER